MSPQVQRARGFVAASVRDDHSAQDDRLDSFKAYPEFDPPDSKFSHASCGV